VGDEIHHLRSLDEVEAVRERLAAAEREAELPADRDQVHGGLRVLAWVLGEDDPDR
jgi:hypothetical protein